MTATLPINPTPWPLAAEKVEGHWTQHKQHDGKRMCLVGALESCGLAPGEWLIARAVARHRDHGEGWNDADDRTETEVVGWLRTAEPITPDELADVFGPQWAQVCAVVLRAARLTVDEAKAINAAWDAAWGAARGAAWDAARDAAWDAALGAAVALVSRDLIGQHGFTQTHYDTLTGPWRKVIGPVHPDDEPLP